MNEAQKAVAPTPPSLFMARRQLSELHFTATAGIAGGVTTAMLELEIGVDVLVGDGLMELKLVVGFP